MITAAYILRIIGRVFFGTMPEEFEGHIGDVTPMDKLALVFLCLLMIGVGVFPSLMVPRVAAGVENILRLVGG